MSLEIIKFIEFISMYLFFAYVRHHSWLSCPLTFVVIHLIATVFLLPGLHPFVELHFEYSFEEEVSHLSNFVELVSFVH